jgi:hypothetical protein
VIARRIGRALSWRFAAVVARLDALGAQTARLESRVEELTVQVGALAAALGSLAEPEGVLARAGEDARAARETVDQRLQPMLRAVLDEEAANRRRLHALRGSPHYEHAYSDPDPLVSVTIACAGRAGTLLERALPSVLSQTHENLEVLVVGDGVGRELGQAVEALGDPRVRFANLTQRITAHVDPRRHWLVGSTMARNEATRGAQGSWLLHFDDDDHLRPGAIAALLEVAREQRAEVAYGAIEEHHPDGARKTLEGFPPRLGTFSWAGALVHGGLRFFERELIAAHLEMPGDMYMLERMLRAGVRFAPAGETVLDYYPSTLWQPHEVRDEARQAPPQD